MPTFYYGGEPYTRIGVVSNGYIVVGGGDSGDIVFTPQHFPNAARPNNTLAPLWSDLNPSATGAGSIRVGDASPAAPTRLDRRRLGRRQELRQRDDALVRGLDPASQQAQQAPARERGDHLLVRPEPTFPGDGPGLGNAGSGDPDSGVNWGAENRDGTSGANIATARPTAPSSRVHTTPPTAGGSVTIPFDIWSKAVTARTTRTPR